MESHQSTETVASLRTEPPFVYLANSLAQLLETAKHELERDRNAAKVSLAKASSILRSEIARRSGTTGFATGGLAAWQIARVRTFIDNNLHRAIHSKELSAVVRLSAAHFARSFKQSFGDPPHAHVMKKRLEKACHLIMTGSIPLSEIALDAGFSDQSHLTKRFKQAFGQSPAAWRRERELVGISWGRLPEKKGSKVRPLPNVDRQQAREQLHENYSGPQPVSSSAD
jgi:AraC family transcriptional regulator